MLLACLVISAFFNCRSDTSTELHVTFFTGHSASQCQRYQLATQQLHLPVSDFKYLVTINLYVRTSLFGSLLCLFEALLNRNTHFMISGQFVWNIPLRKQLKWPPQLHSKGRVMVCESRHVRQRIHTENTGSSTSNSHFSPAISHIT